MKNKTNRYKTWKKSAAGKISLILLCISIVLLILAFSPWGILDDNATNDVNDILIGLATNLLGIIVTVSFVQYFIDRQDEQQERVEEIETIKRYDRLMTVLIERYVMYFNCITTPIIKRRGSNLLVINSDFIFEDLCDMYEQSLYTCEGAFEPSIVLFYNAEEKLRNYMIREVEGVQFKYNEPLKNIFMTFVEKSLACDMRGAILENINVQCGDKKMSKVVQEGIKDPTNNWVEKAHKGELGSNIMLPYVQLYDLLKIETDLIVRYKDYLTKL